MGKKLVQNGSCPVATTISLLNSQWKILIMRDLVQNKVCRYNELKRSVVGISQKMLSQSLKEMQSDGLVSKKIFPEVPPKVEYRLTDLGQSMLPIISSMVDWGNYYLDNYWNDKQKQH
ncbi:winged helix-turn-helix transcriptional regulator [Lactobacillaceae bacterium Scapto_B20]